MNFVHDLRINNINNNNKNYKLTGLSVYVSCSVVLTLFGFGTQVWNTNGVQTPPADWIFGIFFELIKKFG